MIFLMGIALSIPAGYGTTIRVDLGAPERVTSDKIVNVVGLNDIQFNGQMVSLDFVFDANSFVRLFASTSKTFDLVPILDVFGVGTISNPTGSGYLFDSWRNPISSVTSFGGSITTGPDGEAFRLALAGFFPLIADTNGTPRQDVPFPLDIYGAHLDIMLPSAPGFDVTGGEFGLFPNGSKVWNEHFQIGDVPENGGTLPMALGAFVIVLACHSTRRKLAANRDRS
ncbi:MAG: hypothetical protein ACR2FX_08760 [Chthoniobacterales bacterium]